MMENMNSDTNILNSLPLLDMQGIVPVTIDLTEDCVGICSGAGMDVNEDTAGNSSLVNNSKESDMNLTNKMPKKGKSKKKKIDDITPTKMENMPDRAESGVKASLLDEILTEKKLALLKSPEVMKFLQSQQAQVANNSPQTLYTKPGSSS